MTRFWSHKSVGATGYFLQRTDNLLNNTWSNLNGTAVYESDESPEGTESFLDINASSNRTLFYKILLE